MVKTQVWGAKKGKEKMPNPPLRKELPNRRLKKRSKPQTPRGSRGTKKRGGDEAGVWAVVKVLQKNPPQRKRVEGTGRARYRPEDLERLKKKQQRKRKKKERESSQKVDDQETRRKASAREPGVVEQRSKGQKKTWSPRGG